MNKGLEALNQNKYLVIIPDNNMLKYNLNEEIVEKELKAKEKLYDIVKAKYASATRDYYIKKRNPVEAAEAIRVLGQAEAYYDIMLLMGSGELEK